MYFFFGTVSSQGNYVGYGLASPTLEDMQGTFMLDNSWGAEAPRVKRIQLAGLIFEKLEIDNSLAESFADDVLLKMQSDKNWILSAETIKLWVTEHTVVQ